MGCVHSRKLNKNNEKPLAKDTVTVTIDSKKNNIDSSEAAKKATPIKFLPKTPMIEPTYNIDTVYEEMISEKTRPIMIKQENGKWLHIKDGKVVKEEPASSESTDENMKKAGISKDSMYVGLYVAPSN